MDAADLVRTEAIRERIVQLWERTGDAGLGRIVEGRTLAEDADAPLLAECAPQEHADWVSTALMQCFKFSGDPQVFGLLYELNESAFAHAIHAKLRRTISRVDERDVLQEVFLNIYRYPHRFLAEKADSFRNWGHRIVQNTLLKALKLESRRQRATQLQEDLGERPDLRMRTPLRSAADAEQQRAIDRAFLIYLNLYLLHFRQLSAKEQRALILVEVEGVSYRETAAELGVRLENLKMVVFRARRKVFRAMSRTMAELQARGASRAARRAASGAVDSGDAAARDPAARDPAARDATLRGAASRPDPSSRCGGDPRAGSGVRTPQSLPSSPSSSVAP